MKLKLYFVMLAMGFLSFAFQGCSDDDNSQENSVPTQVENAFVQEFGDVAHSWTTTRNGNHVAKFTANNQQQEAWFDATGKWMMTETDIRYEALPAAVQAAFEACNYATWKRDDVDMLERKGMETIYVIEVEKGQEEIDLYFDALGNLLKEVVDTEDDSEDYLPVALPETVQALLGEKYPNHKLLEVEKEKNGMLEIDLLFNNEKIEVYFGKDNQWVATKKEVKFNTLPTVVQEAARKALDIYPGTELDDEEAELVVTPAGKYYIVELEVQKDGADDIEIKIAEDGQLIK